MNDKSRQEYFITGIFLLSVFSLALFKIQDVDAWIHLSMGRLIWEHKGLPASETMLYTMIGQPFSYSSWLFGIIYYGAYRLLDVPGVIVLKGITIAATFFVLLKDSMRPHRAHLTSAFVLIIVALLCRPRFVERPDTFLFLFLSFSIFSLQAYVTENKKYLFALPVVHFLWANSHSSINLMIVPFIAFTIGGAMQNMLRKRGVQVEHGPTLKQQKTILTIFAASFLASLVSPYFFGQYTFGSRFLATDWFKQEIWELRPVNLSDDIAFYIVTAITLASFAINYRRFSLVHFLLVIPFAVLPFAAERFVYPFFIVAGPVIARNAGSVIPDSIPFFKSWPAQFGAAACILFCTGTMILNIASLDPERREFGFGIYYSATPEGALRYMDSTGISGRIFNTFHFGQYILWRDFPGRTVFVDGRGTLPVDLLEKGRIAREVPADMDELQNKYGFDVALVGYPKINPDHLKVRDDIDQALSHSGWALVYWDDAALVYLRRGANNDAVIKRDEYRHILPANGVNSRFNNPEIRSALISELERNVSVTGSQKGFYYLGHAYLSSGRYEEALISFSKCEALPGRLRPSLVYSGMADSYVKIGNLEKALHYFKKALKYEQDPSVFYKEGTIYLAMGDLHSALRSFNEALRINPGFASAHLMAANTYSRLGLNTDAEEAEKKYRMLIGNSALEEALRSGLQAYMERRYEEAEDKFKKGIRLYPGSAALHSNLAYVYYDTDRLEKAYEYQRKALALEPGFANAHYGLALVQKKRGDREDAIEHFQTYLSLQPTGYYARKAKTEIAAMQ